MKIINIIIFSLFLGFVGTISANSTKSSLIPAEDFAKHAQYRNIKISPDAKHLAFTYREGTEVRLAVLDHIRR